MHVDGGLQEHPEALLDRAVRGGLTPDERGGLDRHLAGCADCAAELEAALLLSASTAPGKQDEALDRAAVENALARLQQPEAVPDRVRRWAGGRRWLQRAAGFALVGAAAAVAIGFALHTTRSATPTVATAPTARILVLDDGSEVVPDNATTALELSERTAARTTVRLRSGAAHFRIRHDSRRLFRVDAGAIAIEDLGTVFQVEHQSGGKLRVAVVEGRVAVLYPATNMRVELGAGEERLFSTGPQPDDAAARAEARKPAEAPAVVPPTHAQAHARAGDDPAALLAAADVARQTRHPQAAVAPLRRLLERYTNDPRAPAAAFTLGWVLLTDLGRPREAAAAFAEAERIAPRGALAEDAAARVAEAWQKAGQTRRAAQAAHHYQQMYPSGRYLTLMRGLIGEP